MLRDRDSVLLSALPREMCAEDAIEFGVHGYGADIGRMVRDQPPSIRISWPVRYADASDPRKTQRPTRSSGQENRPRGIRSTVAWYRGLLGSGGRSVEATAPGERAFTVMPSAAHSSARPLVKAATAPLEALYDVRFHTPL